MEDMAGRYKCEYICPNPCGKFYEKVKTRSYAPANCPACGRPNYPIRVVISIGNDNNFHFTFYCNFSFHSIYFYSVPVQPHHFSKYSCVSFRDLYDMEFLHLKIASGCIKHVQCFLYKILSQR